MTEMMHQMTRAAEKASPMAYGRWGARLSGWLALAGTGLSALLGGWDGPVKALIFFMALDFATGFAAACKERAADSRVMLWGGVGKVMVLTLVAAGAVLDRLLALPDPYCRLAVIWFYIGREGLSALENYGKLGLPLPAFLTGLLAQLQQRGEGPSPAEPHTDGTEESCAAKGAF